MVLADETNPNYGWLQVFRRKKRQLQQQLAFLEADGR
jgi:hypothetical protein